MWPQHPCAGSQPGPKACHTSAEEAREDRLGEDGAAAAEVQPAVAFEAPLGQALRRVKVLSVTSLGLALCSTPVLVLLDAGATAAGKAMLAGTLCAFGAFTTGMLHWFASPYVTHVTWQRGADHVTLGKLTFFGVPYTETLKVRLVEPVQGFHPLANFSVRGRLYYLDKDNADPELVELLVPPEPEPGEEGEVGDGAQD